MTISIITATYNSGSTLRQTFDSILAQSFTEIEHIVIDGASTDNTIDIIKEYEPYFNGRLKWISERDGGIYEAMNKGLSMATGDIIGILNSDDFYAAPGVLTEIAKGCRDVEAVYGDLDIVDEQDTHKIIRQWKGSQHTPGAFLKGWHPAHPTFYVRKECYDRLGGYDITFNVSADFELMLRFIEKECISNRYLPITFVKMRVGGESTGSIAKIIQGNLNILRALRKNGFKTTTPIYLIRRLAPKALNLLKNKLHLLIP